MKQTDGSLKGLMFVGLIGIDLAITTIGGFWLGRWLDRSLNTAPLFLIIGVLLGLAVGIFSLIPMVKSFIGGK
jgi:ATP synthase protein I